MRITLAAALAAFIATAPVRAGEEHRELGAHVHGHGTLSIAVEGKRVAMELDVPGMDVAGFEHAATTAEQKAALAAAEARLGKPLDLFRLPAAAGCTVADAKVALKTEEAHEGEHHDEHAGADHEDDHPGHSAFQASYVLDCAEPASLTSIAFDYFKAFAGAQALTVNVVTARAQSTFEVGRDKPELDLGGMM